MILCFSSHKGSEGGEISGNRVSSNHMVINSNLILIIRYVMVILIDLISHSFPLPHPPHILISFILLLKNILSLLVPHSLRVKESIGTH